MNQCTHIAINRSGESMKSYLDSIPGVDGIDFFLAACVLLEYIMQSQSD